MPILFSIIIYLAPPVACLLQAGTRHAVAGSGHAGNLPGPPNFSNGKFGESGNLAKGEVSSRL